MDFYKQLRQNPAHLEVLGDGRQRKSYLYVQDCVDAIFCAMQAGAEKVTVLNLGTDEYCEVNDSIGWICERLGMKPRLEYTGGDRGWIGDNPFIFLDCQRMRSRGWAPKYSIRESVVKTVEYLVENRWLLESRG